MSDNGAQAHAAYIEDYNEDAHTTVPETRQTANVAAKRSKPEISKVGVAELSRDEASDSGYSSRTGATLNSGDSSLVSKAGSATLTLDTSVESLSASKRKPVVPEPQSEQPSRSPNKSSVRRSESKSKQKQKQKEGGRQGPCACDDCLAATSAKGTMRSPESTKKSSPTYYEQAKQRPGPAVDPSPTSRTAKRSAPKMAAEAPIIQPAQPQPRPRQPGASSYRATPRPVSFHGGVMPQPMYYQPLFTGRPPSGIAMQSPFPPPSYPPPTASYFPPQYQQAAPPTSHLPNHPAPGQYPPYQHAPQQQSRQWSNVPQPAPQPSVVYSAPPAVDYPHPTTYDLHVPPTFPSGHRTFSERDRERSIPLRDEYFPYDEDFVRMPPPPRPPSKPAHQRPSIRQSVTSTARIPRHEQYYAYDYIKEEQVPTSPRKHDGEGFERIRRPSVASRQSMGRSDRSRDIDALAQGLAHMSVEGSGATAKQRRRMTFYGGPIHRDLERHAEAYQAQRSADSDATSIPLTSDALKLVRRKTQTSTSDAGSRASGEGRVSREGSDVKSRSDTGHRSSNDIRTSNEKEAFTMRFNTSHGVNVDLKGNNEGRTISLRQSRDGQGNMELSIGAKQQSREKSRRRQSYIDGSGIREVEPARTASRMGRSSRETDVERLKESSGAASRSRRSSKHRRTRVE